jgi:hypothetical protein
MNPKTAFVAMKFDGDHWADKRYQVISDVLAEAGFEPLRADQIKTSGPVVQEVCNYLREATLVVVDSTGDSHSVSYEIGYCHGIARSAEKTILLRQGTDIPFNYRHFRNHCYKDLRHLRRLLRAWLSVIVPLTDDHCGYTFTFEVLPGASDYGAAAAECFLKALQKVKFTGRAEIFASNTKFGKDEFYMIGLGLKFSGQTGVKRLVPDDGWWMKFRSDVVQRIDSANCLLKHAETMSEINVLGAMRQTMLLRATAQFESGLPSLIVGDDPNTEGSWFLTAIEKLMKGEPLLQQEAKQ